MNYSRSGQRGTMQSYNPAPSFVLPRLRSFSTCRSRWRVSASSNLPASWPGPGPGRCWPTSAPTSSRSSARATGDDTRGWGPPFVRRRRRQAYRLGLFPFRQPRQALDRSRLRERGRPPHRAQAGEALGRADREFQGRRARQIRPRLQEPGAGKPAADLLLGHRLRPGRALRQARRLRPDGARHGRHHGSDRHGRTARRPASAWRSPTSSPAAIRWSASWPRSPQREKTGKGCYVDTALVDSTVGVLCQPGAQLSRLRQNAETHRQFAPQHRALPGISRWPTATSSSPPATTTSTSSSATCWARPSSPRAPTTRTMSAGSSIATSWSASCRRSPRR